MDSLAGYGSDDDCEDSSTPKDERKATEGRSSSVGGGRPARKSGGGGGGSQADVNYEEVGMDLSEESSDRSSEEKQPSSKSRRDRRDDRKTRHERDRDRDRDDHRSRRHDSDRQHRKDKHHDREKHREDRRRERQRSRSPRRSEHRGGAGARRSRSRERDRDSKYSKRYDRASNKMAHLDKLGIEIKTPDCQYVTPSELQRSMDDEQKRGGYGGNSLTNNQRESAAATAAAVAAAVTAASTEPSSGNRFFMPGITGRFRDQIEKRKLLWQKKPEPEKTVAARPAQSYAGAGAQSGASGSRAGKLWETTTFAQDSDGKVANKFKRLMGIKSSADGAKSNDVLKKQEEMFSSMEQQYEVARTATHTMRGVGLGFGSFQR